MSAGKVAQIGRESEQRSSNEADKADLEYIAHLMASAVRGCVLLLAENLTPDQAGDEPGRRGTADMVADILRLARDKYDAELRKPI